MSGRRFSIFHLTKFDVNVKKIFFLLFQSGETEWRNVSDE